MKRLLKVCILAAQKIFRLLGNVRQKINQWMQDRISARGLALIAAAFSGLILCWLLFVSPYMGVANDGTVSETMSLVGLSYTSDEVSDNYNNYFVRVYQNVYAESGTVTAHILLLRLARAVDYLFTRDTFFDVRFLAAIYLVLYLPAIYLIVRAALERLTYFNEYMIAAVAGVLIFADGSYGVYFNSLYPEPLLFIALLYVAACAMMLQKQTKFTPLYLCLFVFWALVLCFTRRHCFMVGLVAAAFCVLLLRLFESFPARLGLVTAAVLLAGGTAASLAVMPEEFTDTSKVHAMTRGVLLQSNDPEETLEQFGINSSYALLTDVSLYDTPSLTEEDNPLLQSGFLDKYNTGTIALYYLRHPKALISMLDLGIKASFDLARYYCGNYEQSAGMPERAQNVFWSMWSIFKQRSAPKTIGYMVILIIAYCVMAGRKMYTVSKTPERLHFIYLLTMAGITLIGVANMCYVILQSGDAQLTQYNMVMGVCMDLLFYYVLIEILYKLNILEKGKKAKK